MVTAQNSAKRRRAFLGAAALLLCAWSLFCGYLHDGAFLAPWHDAAFSADVDGDGAPERVVVEGRAARVERGNDVLWESDPAWLVESLLCGDIDGDGANDLALLAWKRGSYGASRPFWVERDEPVYSQHIFLFHWDGGPKPFWMSSALRPELASWALEQDGTIAVRTKAGEEARLSWRTWGLEFLTGARCPL